MADGEEPAIRSDFGVRAASAIAMAGIAGLALWFGGWAWTLFVALVAGGVFREWRGISVRFATSSAALGLWNAAGLVYLAGAGATLVYLRGDPQGTEVLLAMILAVIATDVGAYAAGRTIGGPKIAPRISPSKTWAGLAGGILGASLAVLLFAWGVDGFRWTARGWLAMVPQGVLTGAICAVVAQTGDFFESWMKRRAGLKDSGNLLPGHGGLFDRADGLIAVSFLMGIYIALVHAMVPA